MIGYNGDTKIAKEMLRLLEENPEVKRKLIGRNSKHFHFNTAPPSRRFLGFNNYIVNVQFYPQDRVKGMKENHPNWITTPGCIGCTIENNMDIFFKKTAMFYSDYVIPKKLDINVVFGKTAASSRNTETEIQNYPLNSHAQLKELEYMFPNREITLKHSFNPNNVLSLITVNNITVKVNTPRMSAMSALNKILKEWF